MESEQIYEVLKRLVGPVEPWADSSIDAERFKNMEKFIEIFQEMHTVIDDIAYRYKDSPYGSAKQIGLLAERQIDSMGITE